MSDGMKVKRGRDSAGLLCLGVGAVFSALAIAAAANVGRDQRHLFSVV